MKSFFKKIIVSILGFQVKRLLKNKKPIVIGVVGSIGKTSTKLAIAKILEGEKKVRYQEGNYNDIVSVPLVFFGHKMPKIWDIFSWFFIFLKNEIQILFKYPFEIVVLELGTDGPGQMAMFRKYIHLDIAVISAIAPEHMEFFKSIEAVAEEEWSVVFFSDIVFVNKDLCKIIPSDVENRKIVYYGKDPGSVYKIENITKNEDLFYFDVSFNGNKIFETSYRAFSEIELYSILIAIVLALKFGIDIDKIKNKIKKYQSFSGRMQRLKGIKNTTIIDDTYNASPIAMKIALDSMYKERANQRIAILGMMNELGDFSEEEHKKIGSHCDPKFLDLVVTIGKDANNFLAPEAKKRGCEVYQAKNSKEAGLFVKEKLKEGALILAKGSQNGVFAEESLKPLLANKEDYSKLVRQDKYWMNKKKFDF